MKALLPLYGAIAFLALSMAPAHSRDLKFITIDVAPWASYEEGSQREIGVFPDVVRELERRTGHQISMDFQPFARIDRELESGTQDCTVIIWTDDRSRIVKKGARVSDHPMGVIAKKGVSLENYEDIQPLTVSVLRGVAISPRFDSDATIQKDFDTDYLISIRKIAHNRVQAIAGSIPTIRFLAQQEGLDGYLGDDMMLSLTPLLLQCSKKSPHLDIMPEFNEAIRAMHEDGTMERIFKDNYFM